MKGATGFLSYISHKSKRAILSMAGESGKSSQGRLIRALVKQDERDPPTEMRRLAHMHEQGVSEIAFTSEHDPHLAMPSFPLVHRHNA